MTTNRSERPSRLRALLTVALAIAALAALQASVGSSPATADTTTTSTTTYLCSVLHIGCPTTTTTAAPTTTTTLPPVPTTTVAPDCGGQATVPKPGGGTWSCVFNDEFSGTALDPAKWIPSATTDPAGNAAGTSLQTGTTHGDACIVNSTDNVDVSGGWLHLTARTEDHDVTCQAGQTTVSEPRTTGEVSTYRRMERAFGRIEIRAKLSPQAAGTADLRGLQTSFWLWPTSTTRYPESREEIDIAEMYSQWSDLVIPYIHYNSSAPGNGQKVTERDFHSIDLDQFHTYALEWTETNLRITFDGQVVLDHLIQPNPLTGRTAPEPFDQPFYLILSQGLGIDGNSYRDGSLFRTPQTQLPATTDVDYVRIWG